MVDDGIPEISVARTQAMSVLTQLGFRTRGSHSTFIEYVKSLRRFGIPFSREELCGGSHRRHVYRYEYLMELAVALSFRLHRILPWDVVSVLVDHRVQLRSIYRQAYLESDSGAGRPVQIQFGVHEHLCVKGIFLDLNFSYVDDQLSAPPDRMRSIQPQQCIATSSKVLEARYVLPSRCLNQRVKSSRSRETPPAYERSQSS